MFFEYKMKPDTEMISACCDYFVGEKIFLKI